MFIMIKFFTVNKYITLIIRFFFFYIFGCAARHTGS